VDFAELLLRTHELLRDRPDILHHYRERFDHILVDEFQDTNAIQYAWLRLLAGDNKNLFLVGDDDQSIYGWRGARVENIQSFQKDYPGTRVVRLEQNYRSTGNILGAANALIANNPTRLGKNLWTRDEAGELIRRYAAFNEVDEARFVVERIRRYIVDEGYRRSECAILYRTTAQSRLFEESLIQAQIPYRVFGGLRFFERAEIKDALAYLRLLSNPEDDTSFERVVNTPARGIGAKTLDALRQQARGARCSLWQAATDAVAAGAMTVRASAALDRFLTLVREQRSLARDLDLPELTARIITATGLPEHYEKAKDGKGMDRVENLEELVNATRRFAYEMEDDEGDTLGAFLSHAALEAGEAQVDQFEDGVQLMTMHSAKGLEFPIVFIAGMEEGLFPHSMSANDPERLEEERRLCYVGMTRAMHQLYLCHAETRRLHGSESYPFPSRFLREIPRDLTEEVRGGGVARPGSAPAASASGADAGEFRLGQQVSHPRFGPGTVLNCEGKGASARIQVNFEAVGAKWLVLAYARLEPIT
jgi:DNA helicase-2/ATP-dependent DNA helicase PcrA